MSQFQAFLLAFGLLAAGTVIARVYLSRTTQLVLAVIAAAAHII